MTPNDWVTLATCIAQCAQRGADAIVVTHGTDTMAYSLAAVSFMLKPISIKIPIVFTGALIPHGEDYSDAHQNLWDAILFAVSSEFAGVYLVFESQDRRPGTEGASRAIYWGSRVQSIRPGGRVFDTVDNRPLGRIENGVMKSGKIYWKYPRKNTGEKNDIQTDTHFDDRVEVLKVYPGFDPKLLDNAANAGIRAIIIDLYHSGTACTRDDQQEKYSLIPAIKRLRSNNIAVLGAGAPFRATEQYESTSALVRAGLHPLGRMSLEATVVKAMCLLGRNLYGASLGSSMDKPIYHELYHGD